MEVIAEKQLEKMSQKDRESPNVLLQDVDGNTGENVEVGNNSDIKSVSEAASLAWDVPTLGKYVDIPEKLRGKKSPEKWEPTFL